MFRFNLILRRKSDDIMVFSVNIVFRLLSGLLAMLLALGLFSIIPEEGFSPGMLIPLSLAIICILAVFYEESWVFDRKKRIIVSRYGLMFLNRTATHSFAEIQSLDLKSFLRGMKTPDDRKVFKGFNITGRTSTGWIPENV